MEMQKGEGFTLIEKRKQHEHGVRTALNLYE